MTWAVGFYDFRFHSTVQNDGRCVSDYMMQFLARTDSLTFPSPQEIAAAVGVTRGSPFATDPRAICYDVEIGPGPVRTRPPFLAFLVTAKWATNAPLPAADDDDPTSMRTIWSISPLIQSRYIIKDKSKKLIVNTAGQPYDGGIPVDVRLGCVKARRNRDAAGYDKDQVLALCGRVNSVTYLGGAPGTVQVDVTANERYEGSHHFWEEEYTFSYDPLGWQPRPPSAGFFQRASAGSNDLKRILNEDINDDNDPTAPVQEPEPLTDKGLLAPISGRPDNCAFVEVDYFEEIDMNAFGL